MRLLERLLECFRSDARLAPSDLKIMSVARLPIRARNGRLTIGMRSAVQLRSDTERIQNKQTTSILYSNCTQIVLNSPFTQIEPWRVTAYSFLV